MKIEAELPFRDATHPFTSVFGPVFIKVTSWSYHVPGLHEITIGVATLRLHNF